jgi:hypothetical protein
MTKTCIHTYVGVALTRTNGDIFPCCRFRSDTLPTIFDVDTLNNLHKLPQYTAIQHSLESGIYPPGCSICQQHEHLGIKNKRQYSNDTLKLKNAKLGYVQDLEIALDYTCNMMCRMCSPSASSKWGAAQLVLDQFVANGIEYYSDFDTKIYKNYQDQFQKVFKNTDFKHMVNLKIQGGEPFYAKHFEWFLDKLYDESVDRSEVNLNIFSNGSIFPNKNILKKLENFNTSITFSLDAYGDLATVIRYGVPWQEVETSLRQWADYVKNNNITLCTNTTLSLLNVNMITPLVDFCESIGIIVCYNDLHYPNYLSMYQLPLEVRARWIDHSKKETFNQFLMADCTAVQEFDKFKKSIEILDNYQGVQFALANPEMTGIIDAYIR